MTGSGAIQRDTDGQHIGRLRARRMKREGGGSASATKEMSPLYQSKFPFTSIVYPKFIKKSNSTFRCLLSGGFHTRETTILDKF